MSETLIIGFDGPHYRPPIIPGAWCLTSQSETFQPLDKPHELTITAEDYRGAATPVSLFSGAGDRDADDLPLARRLLRQHVFRICPWAILWLTPGWFGSAHWCGQAWAGAGVALVKSGLRADGILTYSFHETWHLLENHLPADLLAELDEGLARGPQYGRSWGPWSVERTPYLTLPYERRARAFERVALLEIEGCPLPRFRYAAPEYRASEILLAAWHGELAADAQRRRAETNKQLTASAASTRRAINP